ncbi:hypothetical protein T484DRAFT_1816483 [Baffinella frigidus]|nr:hypothetical protein T484DRAFT_1816483 [Cryptophyta sp. CCMP2293]
MVQQHAGEGQAVVLRQFGHFWVDRGARPERRVMAANLHRLEQRMKDVKRMVYDALDEVNAEESSIACTCSRDGIVFICEPYWKYEGVVATDTDWRDLLSDGLAVSFKVEWSDPRYDDGDLRVLRRGEAIFAAMKSQALNPDWDGTPAGDFTITAVDKAGAKLALAMALHPRLGAKSRMSLVSSPALVESGLVCLIADLAVDFSEGQDGGGRARWGWPSPGGTPASSGDEYSDASPDEDED